MYDIVFFGTLTIEIERFLPIMIGLQKQGKRVILFYQDYDYRTYFPKYMRELIRKHDLHVIDYSWYIHSLLLGLLTWCYKRTRIFKFLGLRAKLIKRKIDERLIIDILSDLKPKIIVMPDMDLNTYRDYPYGAYWISRVAECFNIKRIAMWHGSASAWDISLDEWVEKYPAYPSCFDVYLVQNDQQKEWFLKSWRRHEKEYLR